MSQRYLLHTSQRGASVQNHLCCYQRRLASAMERLLPLTQPKKPFQHLGIIQICLEEKTTGNFSFFAYFLLTLVMSVVSVFLLKDDEISFIKFFVDDGLFGT